MIDREKSISVIGLGYIGLPTAALLASNGYTVKGMDISNHAVETINKGKIHIVEPDQVRLAQVIKEGYQLIAYSVDIRMLDVEARKGLMTAKIKDKL